MPDPIRLVDLAEQHTELRPELDAAIAEVLDSGAYILGPQAQAFEEEFSSYLGLPHTVGCNSGTDALILALDAVRLRRGPGKVVTTPFTFFATAEAVVQAGHELVFADIEPDGFNLDPAAANAAADGAIAFLPVHLFGQCADVDAFDTTDRDLIEDAAQAVGATYKGRPAGVLGLAGCFSFYVTKNLGAAGDAGAATSADAEVAAMLRSLRAHGEVKADQGRSYHYERMGRNSRLDGIQAAVLRVKLRRLGGWQEKREANAAFYSAALAAVDGVTPPPSTVDGRHVYHQYAIRAERRDELRAHLGERGIETRVFYPEPLHTMPALRDLGLSAGQFPVAEQACLEVLSLPVHAHLSDSDRERVVEAVSGFYR
ncbi:MAG: DegT/DnrJ/EryC1/StrS family aminotransferase [Planctomycetota bacterium]|jgi:dTDP-4-amino-4,6-dideoxygalactose transaminase